MPVALLTAILPALIPVVSDGLRGVFTRLTKGAGVQPTNVAEAVQLMQAEAEYAKAMAALDAPASNISPWVANLRASARYIAAGVVILLGYGVFLLAPADVDPTSRETMLEMGNAGFSFLFGDRSYMYLKGRK